MNESPTLIALRALLAAQDKDGDFESLSFEQCLEVLKLWYKDETAGDDWGSYTVAVTVSARDPEHARSILQLITTQHDEVTVDYSTADWESDE